MKTVPNSHEAQSQRSMFLQSQRRSKSAATTRRNEIFCEGSHERPHVGQNYESIKDLSSVAADTLPQVSLSSVSDVSSTATATINLLWPSASSKKQFCVLSARDARLGTTHLFTHEDTRASNTTNGGSNVGFFLVSKRYSVLPVLLLLLAILSKSEARTPVAPRHSSSVPVLHSVPAYSSEYQADYPPELKPRVPDEPLQQNRIFFQQGQHSEEDLPVCSGHSVCSKISTYSTPYAERMCRCPGTSKCSTSLDTNDGYTVVDKNLQFKMCEPAKKLPQCKLFGEVSYTMIFYPDNVTQTIVHCTCPKNAVTYVVHKDPYRSNKGYGYFYSFACSPLQLVCKRKEPCRLFSARKRSDFEEVTTTVLCRCPTSRLCPVHHTDHGVVPGKLYSDESLRTYSGYCV